MSYNVSLYIDTGGPELVELEYLGNMTSNVAPMWSLALGHGLIHLHGWLASRARYELERAVRHMRNPANAGMYEPLAPPNGHGSHETAAAFLERLLAGCTAHPKAILEVRR